MLQRTLVSVSICLPVSVSAPSMRLATSGKKLSGRNCPAKIAPCNFWRRRAAWSWPLAVLETLHRLVALAPEPGLQLGALAAGLLALGGRDADIDCRAHASWGIPYFAGYLTLTKPKPGGVFHRRENGPL